MIKRQRRNSFRRRALYAEGRRGPRRGARGGRGHVRRELGFSGINPGSDRRGGGGERAYCQPRRPTRERRSSASTTCRDPIGSSSTTFASTPSTPTRSSRCTACASSGAVRVRGEWTSPAAAVAAVPDHCPPVPVPDPEPQSAQIRRRARVVPLRAVHVRVARGDAGEGTVTVILYFPTGN